jgi:thioredoxin 1
MRAENDSELQELTRQELMATPGLVVAEFGASWCGICRGFAPKMQQLLADHPEIVHLKIEDGRGKPLGRSFRVTLWPTFVLQRDGQVVRQLVRPEQDEMRAALDELTAEPASNT